MGFLFSFLSPFCLCVSLCANDEMNNKKFTKDAMPSRTAFFTTKVEIPARKHAQVRKQAIKGKARQAQASKSSLGLVINIILLTRLHHRIHHHDDIPIGTVHIRHSCPYRRTRHIHNRHPKHRSNWHIHAMR